MHRRPNAGEVMKPVLEHSRGCGVDLTPQAGESMLNRPAARGMRLCLERVLGKPLGLSRVEETMLVVHGQRDTRLTPKAIWNLRERQETGPRVGGIGVSTLSTIETGQSAEGLRTGLKIDGRRPRRSRPRPLGRRETRGTSITRDRRLVTSHFLVDSPKPERLRCAVGGIGTIAN